ALRKPSPAAAAQADRPRKRSKLSYKDQRELDALPRRIEDLEAAQAGLEREVSDPDFYSGERQLVERKLEQLTALQAELAGAYERWEELESQGEDSA
ncbi:MAG: ABC transporter ATP-binding protein, partial [Halioglobus sp.]|nr:ABC transporter ATP-binding protein [Halioglobus sp.]